MSSAERYEAIGAAAYEATIAGLQDAMAAGRLTARGLAAACIERVERIDRAGPRLGSVIELNPEALALAEALDAERAAGRARGPLHGIPVLLKDNIDTADQMATTAGSLAMLGSRPAQDATVAARLRAAGALLLGKANMSEWANFRSTRSNSGWSGRGGQCRNPYALDRSPCGSSSGSAAAVAASLCVVAIGTETDGSIVCPSATCGVVGIKPTVGLTSRAGVIPISATQDTVGPHARSVADAAMLLAAIVGPDERDPATVTAPAGPVDYRAALDPDGLRGARIGVLRGKAFGYSPHADALAEAAIAELRAAGATVVEAAPDGDDWAGAAAAELELLRYEFKDGLNRYLATRLPAPGWAGPPSPRSLAELIAFNEAHREAEMPYFGQEQLIASEARGGLDEPAYLEALAGSRDAARAGLDRLMDGLGVEALVAPTGSPAWLIDYLSGDYGRGSSCAQAARAGYPIVSVPAGYARGLPVGISLIGRAFSEATLIRLAFAYEQRTGLRRPPQLLPSIQL